MSASGPQLIAGEAIRRTAERGTPDSLAAPARTPRRAARRSPGGRTTTRDSSGAAARSRWRRPTGRWAIRLTPTMATSGALITGVVTMPPRGPRLVIVIVDPESSSRVALPVRAASARRATSAAVAHRSRASAWRTTGTVSPASVCVATPMLTASKRVTMPCSSSNRAFICGNVGTASTIARIRNGRTVSRPRVPPNRSLSFERSASSSVTSTSST